MAVRPSITTWRLDDFENGDGTNENQICDIDEGTSSPCPGVAAYTTAAWSPSGKRLAIVTDDGSLRIWNSINNSKRDFPDLCDCGIKSLEWSPDCVLLVVWGDLNLVVLNVVTALVVCDLDFKNEPGCVTLVAWSRNSEAVAIATRSGDLAVWWRARSFRPGAGVKLAAEPKILEWSPSGRHLLVVNRSCILEVFDVSPEGVREIFQKDWMQAPFSPVVISAAWSPLDEDTIACCTLSEVEVWSIRHPRRAAARIGSDVGGSLSIRWSPRGARLALVSDNSITIYSCPKGSGTDLEVLGRIEYQPVAIEWVWTSDRSVLMHHKRSGEVKWWDGTSRPEVVCVVPPDARTSRFSPGGERLAISTTAGSGLEVSVWQICGAPSQPILQSHSQSTRGPISSFRMLWREIGAREFRRLRHAVGRVLVKNRRRLHDRGWVLRFLEWHLGKVFPRSLVQRFLFRPVVASAIDRYIRSRGTGDTIFETLRLPVDFTQGLDASLGGLTDEDVAAGMSKMEVLDAVGPDANRRALARRLIGRLHCQPVILGPVRVALEDFRLSSSFTAADQLQWTGVGYALRPFT